MKIDWFECLKSTNTKLSEDRQIVDNETVYAAVSQTAGKGQRGNSWESTPGDNLTFSILFRPSGLLAADQFVLSEAVCLGITGYLSSIGIDARIKWPNDIYVGDKKICGILIEHSISGAYVKDSIVGIGLNMNQRKFLSDAPNPISAIGITGRSYDLRHELEVLCGYISESYSKISSEGRKYIDAQYRQLLYRLDTEAHFIDRTTGETFAGTITGVAPEGRLLVQRPGSADPLRFAFKEIAYII